MATKAKTNDLLVQLYDANSRIVEWFTVGGPYKPEHRWSDLQILNRLRRKRDQIEAELIPEPQEEVFEPDLSNVHRLDEVLEAFQPEHGVLYGDVPFVVTCSEGEVVVQWDGYDPGEAEQYEVVSVTIAGERLNIWIRPGWGNQKADDEECGDFAAMLERVDRRLNGALRHWLSLTSLDDCLPRQIEAARRAIPVQLPLTDD